jgi:uncharacterized protein (DUF58 family)
MHQSVLSKYVDPETLNRLAGRGLEPRGLVAGTLAGNHKSPFSGFAVEFASHREYVPGDDPKHIDWRVYLTRDESVLDFVPPSNSMAQIVRMTERLDTVKPTRKTRLPECLLDLCGRFGRRSVVLVFSDFFTDVEQLEKALERLRYSRHEVVLFQVMHPDELEFRFEGNVKFRGLEVDEQLLTQPAELRKRYLDALGRFNGRLEEACLRNKVERVVVDTGRNPAEVLVDYLNARSLRIRGR